jgi:hypothetical protein
MKNNDAYPSLMAMNIAGWILVVLMVVSSNIETKQNIIKSKEEIAYVPVQEVVTVDKVSDFIDSHDSLFTFYADTFQIDKEYLINKVKENNDSATFNELDLFKTGNIFSSADESILNYLYNLSLTNKNLFSNRRVPCNKNKEYILNLIDYYCSIYQNVDSRIAKSIAEIESGYSSKYMLNANNIFGGMSSSGLITYKNISYGVLSYIKLLNDSYFSVGLNTVSKIGYKYNPTVNENGVKVANPTWVSNVTRAGSKYVHKAVTTNDLV